MLAARELKEIMRKERFQGFYRDIDIKTILKRQWTFVILFLHIKEKVSLESKCRY